MNKKNCIFIIIFSFFSSFLFAEVSAVKSNKDGAVYYQTLEWESSGYVKSYHVIVEKKSGDDYEQIFDMETRENSHNVSLDSGSYRFKVEFKMYLGRLPL